jgi:rare lipoprotein A
MMTAVDLSHVAATRATASGPAPRLSWLAVLCAGIFAACTISAAAKTAADGASQSPIPVAQARKQAVKLSRLPPVPVPHVKHPPIDHSGRKEIGKASFYSRRFDGRKTANGQRFNPNANTAASKTLPIGTTAKVINLSTRKAATVTVNDRGPYVAGRMLDVTPKVAAKLKMNHTGVAPVVVEPIAVPQPNGRVKLGAGAAAVPPRTIRAAVQTTKRMTSQVRKKQVRKGKRRRIIHRGSAHRRNIRAVQEQRKR